MILEVFNCGFVFRPVIYEVCPIWQTGATYSKRYLHLLTKSPEMKQRYLMIPFCHSECFSHVRVFYRQIEIDVRTLMQASTCLCCLLCQARYLVVLQIHLWELYLNNYSAQ